MDQVLARADEQIAQKFAGRPLIEASIRHALGQAYVELGQYQKAEQHAARAVELRLAGSRPRARRDDRRPERPGLGPLSDWVSPRKPESLDPSPGRLPARRWDRSTWRPSRRCTTWPQPSTESRDREARALNESCWRSGSGCSGPEHPKTLATMNNLAGTGRLGELEKAKLLYEQTLAVRTPRSAEPSYGSMAMSNLFFIYHQLGQFDRAIDMGRSLMEGRIRVLGLRIPSHRSQSGVI